MKKLTLTVCAFMMTASVSFLFASTHESNDEPTQTDSVPADTQTIIALSDTVSSDTIQLIAMTDDNEPVKEENGDKEETEKKEETKQDSEPASIAMTDENEPTKEEQPTEQEPTKEEPSQEENVPTGTPEKEALA